ncbi:RNA editing 3' terminal uridylyl transferase 1 [Trypanosoma cruzi]|nr:RNA editing 3' terminal uridylyl transferase 1 [Trypanosoma cruzi]
MVSKYRRLLQHDTSEENENGEMENTRQQQKKQTNIRSCKASVRASDEDEDDEIVLDELHEEEDVTEGEGGQKKVSDAHSAGASADAAAPSVRRFGKGRKEVDSATLSVGDHEDEVDVKSDQTASREGYARNSVDAKDHKNKNKFVVDGKEEKEDEDEEDVDAGEDQEEDDDDDDANAKDTAITGGVVEHGCIPVTPVRMPYSPRTLHFSLTWRSAMRSLCLITHVCTASPRNSARSGRGLSRPVGMPLPCGVKKFLRLLFNVMRVKKKCRRPTEPVRSWSWSCAAGTRRRVSSSLAAPSQWVCGTVWRTLTLPLSMWRPWMPATGHPLRRMLCGPSRSCCGAQDFPL